MKHKILSFLTAFAMVFGIIAAPFVNANAAETDKVTKTVTLHKLIMDKETLAAWDSNAVEKGTAKDGEKNNGYNGSQNLDQLNTILESINKKKVNEIKDVYFALKFASDFKIPKDNTTIIEKDVKDGKAYVKAKGTSVADKLVPATPLTSTTDVKEAVGGLTIENAGVTFQTSELKGKFEIDEIHSMSKYVGPNGEAITDNKAVPVKITLPLVNSDGVVESAHVYPKNTQDKPQIDKNFLKNNELTAAEQEAADKLKVGADYNNYQAKKATAKAEIGKNVPYEVKTEIPANSNLAEAHWDDIMTEGLTYNKDLKVTIGGKEITPSKEGENAELVQTDKGFSLRLQGKNLALLNGKDAPVTVELKYSATVNSKAIVDIPESNDITFHYGNTPSKGNTPKPTKPNENGEVSVEKTWGGKDSDWVEGEYAKFKLVDANTGEDVKASDLDSVAGYTFESEVTLEKGGKTSYTWKGLKKDKSYKVVETESKTLSDAEYTKAENGKIEVTNHKSTNPKPLNPTEPKVVTGGKKFVKTNQEGTERLAGAVFYVKNSEGKYLVADKKDANAVKTAKKALDKAVETYNNLDADKQTDEEKAKVTTAQEAYNKAFIENATAYKWEAGNANAIELTSDGKGKFEITGLEYGDYKLEEKTPPKGFAKLNGDIDFKVAKGSYVKVAGYKQGEKAPAHIGYDNDKDSIKGQQIENKKVSIPQTGGIGSIIFVVAGLTIMGLAAYKMKANKEQA
ncbi:pilin N-terminal domain-containing protein [Anaerococcus jeddahensis]|uniref:pilin N-terminal domain-containing protein n=1 Tax=Anaerococcus jeddahensis TaxID=1673719 RepID=UPI0006723B4B|nr:pilin N-terminal domain-containing protein [Anaerococcus jeddahensis]